MNQTANTLDYGDWSDFLEALGEGTRAPTCACGRVATGVFKCHIQWPEDGLLRVPRGAKRNNARVSRKHPSFRRKQMVKRECEIERKGLQLLEACPFVTLKEEQPAAIYLMGAGGQELQTHYPDALVAHAERRIFVDFESARFAGEPTVRARTASLQHVLAMQGYGYCVLTEEVIEQQPRLRTMQFLLVCGRRRVDEEDAERIRLWFGESGGRARRWAEITGHPQAKVLVPQVSRLILEGRITMPLKQALEDQTELFFR